MDQSSSLLLDIDGLVVDRVVRDDDGRRVVHCSTDPELAGWCPECGEQSRSPKAWVTTRPRDVRLVLPQDHRRPGHRVGRRVDGRTRGHQAAAEGVPVATAVN